MRKFIRSIFQKYGYDIVKQQPPEALPPDFEEVHKEILKKVRPYTMTSDARVYSLIEAVKYTVDAGIEGAFVECGVWKGGSMMAVAETLKRLSQTQRSLFLYDTFEGMSAPTEKDVAAEGETAEALLDARKGDKESNLFWCYSGLEEVKNNLAGTTYPQEHIHYIKGMVEDTIPATLPGKIALLRLDTDWYESTAHEMKHLFPLLQENGLLIIDDYGYWSGAKKAVDEYFEGFSIRPYLSRIDETGRSMVKSTLYTSIC